jgi:H+-transporting ATPase
MVTGDHLLIAKETARQLGMGQGIRDASMLPKLDADGKPPPDLTEYFEYVEETHGFAQVFPEHKFLIVEVLRRGGYKVRCVASVLYRFGLASGGVGLCWPMT